LYIRFSMENLDAYIAGLAGRVEKLAKVEFGLNAENAELKTRNGELEQMITDQKNVVSKLEEQNKVVKIAKSVIGNDDDCKEQRKKLNELVREVDKCIALLNN
jgi:cell division protein FtsB